MTKQTVGLGASANDGTGDTLRVAGDKINDNFDEIYGMVHPGYVAGRYYIPTEGETRTAGLAIGADSLRLMPITIRQTITISELCTAFSTASAGGLVGLAIYANGTGKPTGTPLASITGMSTTATGPVATALASNVQLQPGVYWAGILCDNATAICYTFNRTGTRYSSMFGGTLANVFSAAAVGISHLLYSTTYAGGFPDMTSITPTETVTNGTALIGFKVASVP